MSILKFLDKSWLSFLIVILVLSAWWYVHFLLCSCQCHKCYSSFFFNFIITFAKLEWQVIFIPAWTKHILILLSLTLMDGYYLHNILFNFYFIYISQELLSILIVFWNFQHLSDINNHVFVIKIMSLSMFFQVFIKTNLI